MKEESRATVFDAVAEPKLDTLGLLVNWSIYLSDDNSVCSLTMVPIKEFGEVGQYTFEQVNKLNKLLDEVPRPIWSEDQWTVKQQINEYSTLVKSLLK